LNWYIEALCLGVTIGFSEVLLAIYYGSQDINAMLLAMFITVPAALGAITQAIITNIKILSTHVKRLAICAMLTQVAGLLLMSFALLKLRGDGLYMFLGQCMYWIGGMTSTSPTQDILAHSIDVSEHNRFFSRRALVMTILTLICNLSSARILDQGLTNHVMAMFLLIAAGARLLSTILVFFSGRRELKLAIHNPTHPPDEAVISIIKLSIVMMLFRCAVNLSSPFYSTYMLQEIDLTLTIYSFLTAIPLVTKALFLTNWARLLDDNRKFEGLAISTFAIGIVPVLWAISSGTHWLSFLQFLSGMSWAGFDLISILLIQNMYPQSITQKLGIYLALSSLGSVLGSLLGGLLLSKTGDYHTLFALSGILRLTSGFGLLWYLRRHHLFRFKKLQVKTGIATLITVRPSLEAAAKILPVSLRKESRSQRSA
jgi:hypothetical protein